jgi:DNA-binding HxlR family transcriptional regulator
MKRKSFAGMSCSIARALDEVGEWWSLLIIRECTQGSMRFEEFQRELGVARNILAARLDRLVELGVIETFALEDRANTDGYRLTAKGEALYPVLASLKQWGDQWLNGGKASTEWVEDASGEPLDTMMVRTRDGRPVSFREIRYEVGPGAMATTASTVANRNRKVLGRA